MPWLAAILLSLAFLTFPKYSLSVDVESAWESMLAYAHAHGLQFGKDIVYPYGPLGFLLVRTFTPFTDGTRMVFDALLCLSVSSSLCLLAWRLKLAWRVLILAAFLLVVTNKLYGVEDLLIDTGLLGWGLLCFLESGRRFPAYAGAFVLLAGFSSLAKFTWLLSGTVTVCALTVELLLRKKPRLALYVLAGYLGVVVVFWALAGQAIRNLPSFLMTGIAICGDYDLAMSTPPQGGLFMPALCTSLLAAGLILFRCVVAFEGEAQERSRLRRSVVAAWLLASLFLCWKHGWVRADRHHNFLFIGFLTVLFLALEALPVSRKRWLFYCQCAGGFGAGLALVLLQASMQPGSWRWGGMFTRTAETAGILLHPHGYFERLTADLEHQRKTMDLPAVRRAIGNSGIDVFGNFQTHAVLSGLNVQPRPVFQSYVAYNLSLMKLNEEFYFGAHTPKYVLTTLEPIDKHFTPLEDAFVLRNLLINYEPRGLEQGFVLMKQRADERPRLTLLHEGFVKAGQKIGLTNFGADNLWIQVHAELSLFGRLRRALYQVPAVQLDVFTTSPTNAVEHFNAPAPMLAAGFVASPLLVNDEQLLHLYAENKSIRPQAYTVRFDDGGERCWSERLGIRIYRIENTLGSCPK